MNEASLSDHSPVLLWLAAKSPQNCENLPVPSFVAKSSAFREYANAYVRAARLDLYDPVDRIAMHKLALREAAKKTIEDLHVYGHEKPVTKALALVHISRVVRSNHFERANILMRRCFWARKHIVILDTNVVRLRNPIDFQRDYDAAMRARLLGAVRAAEASCRTLGGSERGPLQASAAARRSSGDCVDCGRLRASGTLSGGPEGSRP